MIVTTKYKKVADLEREQRLIGYLKALRLAWNELDLSEVVCVNYVPTLYILRRPNTVVSVEELSAWHALVWNQGIASAMLVLDSKRAYLYSGFQRPQKQQRDGRDPDSPLIDSRVRVDWTDERHQALLGSIRNGEFYETYRAKFQPGTCVDQTLTSHLNELVDVLADTQLPHPLERETAQNLVCRLLFVCYLIDRKIVVLGGALKLVDALGKHQYGDSVEFLYGLFRKLRDNFNGSMFDTDLDGEQAQIDSRHIQAVISFLKGDSPKSDQGSFGFWPYNFKMIPIETISAIYEQFIPAEQRRGTGSFYTPRLLAEFVLDVAIDDRDDWSELAYLDPSCGSGVFLVALFNRLITKWELDNREKLAGESDDDFYRRKHEALTSVLRNQIRGIDINTSACRLASFSLYIAMLDSFSPDTLHEYLGKAQIHKLPKLIAQDGVHASKDSPYLPVLHGADTLKTDLLSNWADVVIGNPPWGGGGGKRGTNDPSFKFLDRTPHFLKGNGEACLLLPSSLFLNIHNDKQINARWLAKNTVKKVVQLADLRHALFKGAIAPCMIVHYGVQPLDPEDEHRFIYETPQASLSSIRRGFITIGEQDVKLISQPHLQRLALEGKAHVEWKRQFRGTPRDTRLLGFLDTLPRLDDLLHKKKKNHRQGWASGQGINSATGNIPAWWSPDDAFIDSDSIALQHDYFVFADDFDSASVLPDNVDGNRIKNRAIFSPPMLIFNEGYNRFVYSDAPVLFKMALQSIHAPEEDIDLLLFLLAYLKSPLSLYYLFHSGSRLGVERVSARLTEVRQLPFPLPHQAPSPQAATIVSETAQLIKNSREEVLRQKTRMTDAKEDWIAWRKKAGEVLNRQCAENVYRYFDLPGEARWLIEDTITLAIPSATPTNYSVDAIPRLRLVPEEQQDCCGSGSLRQYAETLAATLNGWAVDSGSEWRVSASGATNRDIGVAMVNLVVGKEMHPYSSSMTMDAIGWENAIRYVSERKVVENRQRAVFVLDGKNLRILRSIFIANWTRTAALNDADEIFTLMHNLQREASSGV